MSNQILIPFTREEWDLLHWALDENVQSIRVHWDEDERMIAVNILDRIEKNLGVE